MNISKRMSGLACLFFIFITVLSQPVYSQTELDERAVINFHEGLGFFDPDSLFGVNIRFRMQNRVGMTTVNRTNLSPQEFEANVRRLRLRFDGFLGQNNFTYYLQLSFSRGDQDWDNSGFPGIVRDAMVFYTFSPSFYIGFGQGKLPGNRQRVVSSGALQFADRSAVNAIFNIDRDFGVMAYYTSQIGGLEYRLKSAISAGEGRNITRTDDGLSYTARIELLPLGEFLSDGDFFEGDLKREPSPKISLGAGASFNHKASRTAGQRGVFTGESQDILSSFIDLMAKYNGWALAMEYAARDINNQKIFSINEQNIYSFTGWGLNSQLSYVLPGNYEIAGRYTYIEPDNTIKWYENKQEIITLGFSRYFPAHRNKVQLNISYQQTPGPSYHQSRKEFWNIMFQIETGI
ncbi:MAG: porin [Bacteroidetes bacterium]|nr:MAG: porin [Bacteroidota bacterium]